MKGHFLCVTDLCVLEGAGKEPQSSSFSLGNTSSVSLAGDTDGASFDQVLFFFFSARAFATNIFQLNALLSLELDV